MENNYLPLKEGGTYLTKIGDKEFFTITKIVYLPKSKEDTREKISYVFGIYSNCPHIGECILNPERIIPNSYEKSYLKEKMDEFSGNINDYKIGQVVIDDFDKTENTITDKTINTICVLIPKKSPKGVTSSQWFDIKSFNKKFKIKSVELNLFN